MSIAEHGQANPSGPRKAAILISLVGEEAASLVLKHMPAADVERIAAELAKMDPVDANTVHGVLEETVQHASQTFLPNGTEYALQVLTRTFGEAAGKEILQRVIGQREIRASELDWLQKADPQQLARFLESEHPQAVALILAHLEAKQASGVLMKLPEALRADALKRLAQLKNFSPDIVRRVSAVLHRKQQAVGEQQREAYAGFEGVASVMNRLGAATATSILGAIEQEQPDLAVEIRKRMFTFEDLLSVPETALREWLSALDKKTLALALKGASEGLKDHIFRGMSSRAVAMLKEDMEALGPVRGKEVTKAQEEAVAAARQLEADGKIVLRPDGEDEYLV